MAKDVSCETIVLDNKDVIDDEVLRNSEKNAPTKQRNDLNPVFFPVCHWGVKVGVGIGLLCALPVLLPLPKSKY